jgi:hypothetical protein
MSLRSILMAIFLGGLALGLSELGCDGIDAPGPPRFPGPDGGSLGGPPGGNYDGGLVPNDGGFQDAPMTVHLDGGAPPGDGGGF